ncbi:MAG: HAMP domain-containing protein [Desulfamplus sp.]|nr:HAMP domain-containing protein [Desulfamplus sp.]
MSTGRIFQTLAFRLTVWYAGIFTLSSCAVFLLFYFLVSQTILDRLDEDLLDKAGLFSAVFPVQGIPGLKRIAVLEARAAGEKKIFFRLLYLNGEVFASSYMDYWHNVKVDSNIVSGLIKTGKYHFKTLEIEPDRQRVRVLYHLSAPGVVLQTGISMDTYSGFLAAFKRIFGGSMAIVVILSAVCGGFMSRKALGGLGQITRTAREISGGTLSARVPEGRHQDELNELAKTFNSMLDRIELLVKNIREMSDNIAHDLRSPLTRIRGLAEVTLLHSGTHDEYEAMAASTIEEADRLLDMISTMLVISRTEAGVGGFQLEMVNISHILEDACRLFHAVAEDAGIDFTFTPEPDLLTRADRGMIQRAISNLIDNALKYTSPPGKIEVRACAKEDSSGTGMGRVIEIKVMDTGQGISAEHIERVFDRFYRADPSRNRRGTGLGLSFARAVAREHRGDIGVQSTPGQGSIFTLTLPYGNIPII